MTAVHNNDLRNPGVATDAFAIVPAGAGAKYGPARSIYVGGTGNVVIETPQGTIVTFTAVPAGFIIPCASVRVDTTSTATLMVGLL